MSRNAATYHLALYNVNCTCICIHSFNLFVVICFSSCENVRCKCLCPTTLECNETEHQFLRHRNAHRFFERKTCVKKISNTKSSSKVRNHIEIRWVSLRDWYSGSSVRNSIFSLRVCEFIYLNAAGKARVFADCLNFFVLHCACLHFYKPLLFRFPL